MTKSFETFKCHLWNTPLFSLFIKDNNTWAGVRMPQGSRTLHQVNVAVQESHWAGPLGILTWNKLDVSFKLIYKMHCRKFQYLLYILHFYQSFHRCAHSLTSKSNPEKFKILRSAACVFYLLLYPPCIRWALLFTAIIIQVLATLV